MIAQRLNYSKAVPTTPGFYWWKRRSNSGAQPVWILEGVYGTKLWQMIDAERNPYKWRGWFSIEPIFQPPHFQPIENNPHP